MADIQKVAVLRQKALVLQLENVAILDKYSNAELAVIYNGIGPDSFPEWLREFVTSLHPTLEVVALIHDTEWHESDKSRTAFSASNQRFKANGVIAAKHEFGWYNPRRYLVMNQARRFGNLCEVFGWSGWVATCQCPVGKEE